MLFPVVTRQLVITVVRVETRRVILGHEKSHIFEIARDKIDINELFKKVGKSQGNEFSSKYGGILNRRGSKYKREGGIFYTLNQSA